MPELEELAGSRTLAGAEGARVPQSLMPKAESLRQPACPRRVRSQRSSERMAGIRAASRSPRTVKVRTRTGG